MNKDLFVKDSSNGKGVFANKDFEKGEFIIRFKGDFFTDLPENDTHFIQVGENLHLGPSGEEDDFINHSCNPNSGLIIKDRDIKLISIEAIKKNEEITMDYSTTEDTDWKMRCNCGAKNCRKVISAFRHLPKKLKERYIVLGIVPEYITKDLDS